MAESDEKLLEESEETLERIQAGRPGHFPAGFERGVPVSDQIEPGDIVAQAGSEWYRKIRSDEVLARVNLGRVLWVRGDSIRVRWTNGKKWLPAGVYCAEELEIVNKKAHT